MNSYLMVGIDYISEDLYRDVCDSLYIKSIKPNGGLWFTLFDMNFSCYNEWVDFILKNKHLLFYKNKGESPFILPCLIAFFRDDINIFHLDSKEKYEYLKFNFSSKRYPFSFEALQSCYDGIYVDLFSLNRQLDLEDKELFSKFGVSSMLLFNIDMIDYYYSGVVDIEPFDYEDFLQPFRLYNIRWDSEKKYVKKK